MRALYILLLLLLAGATCPLQATAMAGGEASFHCDTLSFYDSSRGRLIPALFYTPDEHLPLPRPLVIVSHGYGANDKNIYANYSFLCEYLADKGYFVVSLRHELPTDSLIPSAGKPQVVRRPFWERGADNIRYAIKDMIASQLSIDYNNITLIGHSNGGDMVALFPVKYPNVVQRIITLDNRRMPLPCVSAPRVYSLRSSDQPADEGVLPTESEQKKYGITIIKLSNTIHNDMNDNASAPQREEMRRYILSFLKDQL